MPGGSDSTFRVTHLDRTSVIGRGVSISVAARRRRAWDGQLKRNVGEYLKPGNKNPWDEVCERLNQKLRGWQAYFGLGSTARAYRAIDEYVEERVRHFLRGRQKVSTQGTRPFSKKQVYGNLGVHRLRGPLRAAAS